MKSTLVMKTISLALISSMCVSLAACNNEPDPTTTETSESVTTSTTATETTTEAPTETEPSETGPDFSKSYTYSLYTETDHSMTLDMNVNIDDYITKTDDGEVFELFRLASDLGWLEKGNYTYADYEEAVKEDPNQKKIGKSNWFSFSYGDHRSIFIINENIDDIPDYGRRQVSRISFEYTKNEFSLPFFDDATSNPAHGQAILFFPNHFERICYYVGGQRSMCSRDDAIIIAYSLWAVSNSPDDNTVVTEPFERFRYEGKILL